MVQGAMSELKGGSTVIERCHTSSLSALRGNSREARREHGVTCRKNSSCASARPRSRASRRKLFRAACTDKKGATRADPRSQPAPAGKGPVPHSAAFRDGNALLYLYRPARLKIDLKNELARRTLGNAGYLDESPERCIVNLIRRFQGEESRTRSSYFQATRPKDVQGFIENHAELQALRPLESLRRRGIRARPLQNIKNVPISTAAAGAQGASLEALTVAS